MQSTITTAPFQAQNSNIANDGSADSPRGYAISTDSNITMTIANTRVFVTAVTASRTVTLPTTSVKAGMVVEVQTACTSPYTIAINSSGANLIDTLKGTKGSIKLMALQDTPTTAAHWRVTDVYDEGTWTPTIIGGSTAGTGTYTTQTGIFVRNNNSVALNGFVSISNHTGSGTMLLGGLPFTSKNTANMYSYSGCVDHSNLTTPANSTIFLSLGPNSAQCVFAAAVAGAGLQGVVIDTAFGAYFSISYPV